MRWTGTTTPQALIAAVEKAGYHARIAAANDTPRVVLFWAFVYNVVGIPLAAAGLLSPVTAGAMMAFSSVSVVGNALLLRRGRVTPSAGTPDPSPSTST